jgi:hypothetical protein
LYSGALGKEAISSLAPTSYVREEGKTTTYGNISQTYQLFIPFNKTGDKYKNIKDVVEKGEYEEN